MTASHEWATRPADQRFESLASLRAAVHSRRTRSRAIEINPRNVRAELVGTDLVFNSAISPVTPTNWSFGQFSGILRAPASYLRTLPGELLLRNLNHGLENAPADAVKFMTVAPEDDGRGVLQAVTSKTYGRIWDADCVDAVGRIVERSGGRFKNPLAYDRGNFSGGRTVPSGLYASDRDIFMFMIDGGSRLEAGPRAKLNRGFFVSNSEVGAAKFTLTTFLFNEVCGNHIVWGAQDINELSIRHTAGGPARFDSEAYKTLENYVNAAAAPVESAIRKAQDFRLPTGDGELETLVARFKFTRSELKEAVVTAKREEGQCASLWDLVQGMTAYARGFEHIDTRAELEKRAGAMLKLVSA